MANPGLMDRVRADVVALLNGYVDVPAVRDEISSPYDAVEVIRAPAPPFARRVEIVVLRRFSAESSAFSTRPTP